jgi:hypothetical protein
MILSLKCGILGKANVFQHSQIIKNQSELWSNIQKSIHLQVLQVTT